MRITLKTNWLGHKQGSEVDVNEPTGLRLIESGLAKVIAETPPSGYVTCTRCGAFVKSARAANKRQKGKRSEPEDTLKSEPEDTPKTDNQ